MNERYSAECGSGGSPEMSRFHGLSGGNIEQPASVGPAGPPSAAPASVTPASAAPASATPASAAPASEAGAPASAAPASAGASAGGPASGSSGANAATCWPARSDCAVTPPQPQRAITHAPTHHAPMRPPPT